MHFEENNFYHIYNRSFNHTKLFYRNENYIFFREKLHSIESLCKIMAYCLMPDHFHLLIYFSEEENNSQSKSTGKTSSEVLSRKIGTILSSYTQAINKQEVRAGSLFQPKTKAKWIDNEDYLRRAFHYIHQNPLRAGLVKNIQDWKHSSFQEFFHEKFEFVDRNVVSRFIDVDLSPDSFLRETNLMVPEPPDYSEYPSDRSKRSDG